MKKNLIKYYLAVVALVVFGVIWILTEQGKNESVGQQTDFFHGNSDVVEEENQDDTKGQIYIHITGAVRKPGVYIFDRKPRVVEVVEQAGGFLKNADTSLINQAEMVEDGSRIVIERKKKQKRVSGQVKDSGQSQGDTSGIDINTATREELMTLEGIGESKAMAIMNYREEHGKFQKIEDIMNITGIKSGVFEKIKNRIKV